MTAQQHTIQRRMVETIDRQLAGGDDSYILRMRPKKLRMVRSFVLSFILERGDRVIPYMDFPEPEGVEPVALGKPSDIEVIAERLAKVEDRLDDIDARLDTQSELRIRGNSALDQRISAQNEARHNLEADLTRRIDKVAEIIGERVSGLVDDIRDVATIVGEHREDTQQRLDKLEKPWEHEPGFPTGGAHTADAATEAVLPVPQRGDRVRLEGARSNFGTRIEDGWWDVHGVGQLGAEFQIGRDDGLRVASPLYWVAVDSPGLKEVRHAQP